MKWLDTQTRGQGGWTQTDRPGQASGPPDRQTDGGAEGKHHVAGWTGRRTGQGKGLQTQCAPRGWGRDPGRPGGGTHRRRRRGGRRARRGRDRRRAAARAACRRGRPAPPSAAPPPGCAASERRPRAAPSTAALPGTRARVSQPCRGWGARVSPPCQGALETPRAPGTWQGQALPSQTPPPAASLPPGVSLCPPLCHPLGPALPWPYLAPP